MSPSSAAIALRESFGDRKLPDISRKITACVACRKLKIKCHMEGNKPPCSRCKTRGISCTVNKSLQMLLENDASWKEAMEDRINKLENALMQGSLHVDVARAQSKVVSNGARIVGPDANSVHHEMEMPYSATLNLSCSLGAFPAASMVNVELGDGELDPGYRPDLISCGVISHQQAETYFRFYQQNLDPYIHCILAEDDNLANVRSRSSLLTAAVCTVAAFSTSSKDYRGCLNAFTKEISSKVFGGPYDFDDVRALCIGAFWLNEVASALNGLAVRIATELDLHRCITKMPHTKRACYDRTRLYFLVYLCDHHCSLIYGRPPMTREWRSLKSPGAFLQSEFATHTDLKLICQVELWSISRRVFEQFGADIENAAAKHRPTELEQLSAAYDRWYQDWLDALTLRETPDGATQRVFDLYFHSAKLYLFSHVFRGRSKSNSELQQETIDRSDFADSALKSALAIVRCIVDADESQPWLQNLPFYFETMIAFASVCLLRTSQPGQTIWADQIDSTLEHLNRLVKTLRSPSTINSSKHPLSSVASSIDYAMNAQQQQNQDQLGGVSDDTLNNPSFDFDLFSNEAMNFSFLGDNDWIDMSGEANLPVIDIDKV